MLQQPSACCNGTWRELCVSAQGTWIEQPRNVTQCLFHTSVMYCKWWALKAGDARRSAGSPSESIDQGNRVNQLWYIQLKHIAKWRTLWACREGFAAEGAGAARPAGACPVAAACASRPCHPSVPEQTSADTFQCQTLFVPEHS